MPNGGYPMHLHTPLGDSGVEIQTAALLYHLLYWMGFHNEELLKSIRQSLARTGFTLNPHFNKHGCFYDY